MTALTSEPGRYFDSLVPPVSREMLERQLSKVVVPPHPTQQNLGQRPMPLPEHVRRTFSWECPTCHEWEHGYATPQLAAQELFEHEGERHD